MEINYQDFQNNFNWLLNEIILNNTEKVLLLSLNHKSYKINIDNKINKNYLYTILVNNQLTTIITENNNHEVRGYQWFGDYYQQLSKNALNKICNINVVKNNIDNDRVVCGSE